MSPEESKPQQHSQPTPQTPQTQPARNNPQQQQRPPGGGRPDQRGGGDRRDQRRAGGDQRRSDAPRPPRSPEDRNTVFIGNKPPMNYVLAVVTQFNGGSDEVIIRARGKAIAQAVDVAEIVRNKFFPKAAVKNVSIGTENVTGDDGRKRAISAIEIRLHNTEGKAAAQAAKPPLPQTGAAEKAPVEPAVPAKSSGI